MKANEAIKLYRELSQKKTQLKAEYDEKVAPVEEKLRKIEICLLNYMQEIGVLNLKTEEGTAYITTRESVSCADKAAFMDYVKNSGLFDLLEVRPSKPAVIQFKEGHDALPPGIDWAAERVVRVRKA